MPMDYSFLIDWMGPITILWVSGLFIIIMFGQMTVNFRSDQSIQFAASSLGRQWLRMSFSWESRNHVFFFLAI